MLHIISKAHISHRFLLAQLHLDSLIGKRSPNAVRTTLKSLRKESKVVGHDNTKVLDFAYKQAMERIEGQVGDQHLLGKQVLSWIACARRPLKTSELQCALAVELDTDELNEENIPELEDMVSVCAGLVTIDKVSDVIRLVHYTMQEFFERTWTNWFSEAQSDITNICVTYLSFSAFVSGACDSKVQLATREFTNVLYNYAASNWGHHSRGGYGDKERILKFLKNEQQVARSTKVLFMEREPKNMTGVHLAAFFGLDKITADLISNGYATDLTDSEHRDPLSYAAEAGYKLVVDVLLEAGATVTSVDRFNRTALWYAA